jgi:trehalose 2-sulfotransferase
MITGLTGFSSPRYDCNGRGPFRLAYVIAASYRSGSTHLCTRLWRTGRLGAPFEYFNYEHEMKYMTLRLGALSPDDYVTRLIACRMTDNGVFGLKAHFPHFRAALRTHPTLLQRLDPLQFILIQRQDKVAQAVSFARALQTRAWLGLQGAEHREVPLFYSAELIAACLEEIRVQEQDWLRWFDSRGIVPHPVSYEDLMRDEDDQVQRLCKLLGVESDVSMEIKVPVALRQGDAINTEWIERFEADRRSL